MQKHYTWEHPYVEVKKGASWRVKVGSAAHLLAVAAAVASFGFITWGGVEAWSVLAK